jgi:hypothetical protein
MPISKDVADQIESAYDYRGHVTLQLVDDRTIEGFLFNRELSPLKGEPYIEIIRKDSDEKFHLPARKVKSITLSGKDFAVPFVPAQKN